jgi:hypothetical protein
MRGREGGETEAGERDGGERDGGQVTTRVRRRSEGEVRGGSEREQ